MMGQTVVVQVTQAEKNRMAAATVVQSSSTGPTRLYVGSLHYNITEEDLEKLFKPFGELEFVQIHMDPETRRSSGYGFVQFKRPDDAKKALAKCNGLELAGRPIKVGPVAADQKESGISDLDDEGEGGLRLNTASRALLMQKLQQGRDGPAAQLPLPSPAAGLAGLAMLPNIGGLPLGLGLTGLANFPLGGVPGLPLVPGLPNALGLKLPGAVPVAPSAVSPTPSVCILLKNMFDPKQETEPNFDEDIKEDVKDEVSKHGAVKHIFVDKASQGFVYIKFENVDAAKAAFASLNHRWFAGKMITAEFVPEATYTARFPESQ